MIKNVSFFNCKFVQFLVITTEYIGVEIKQGECILHLSWSIRYVKATFYARVNVVKGGGAPPHQSGLIFPP